MYLLPIGHLITLVISYLHKPISKLLAKRSDFYLFQSTILKMTGKKLQFSSQFSLLIFILYVNAMSIKALKEFQSFTRICWLLQSRSSGLGSPLLCFRHV